MAKYKKRPDGRYMVNIKIGFDENGKQKYKSIYGKSIREVDAKVTDFRSLMNKGIIVDDEGMTLGAWSEKWLKAYKEDKEHNTYAMYENCVKNHIKKSDVADTVLSKITALDLQTLINERLKKGNKRTAEILRMTLRQIFDQAIQNDLVYRNVASHIKIPTVKAPPKRTITQTEETAIEKAELTNRERAFLYIGLYAGLRRGEILALSQGDIDFEESTITVSNTLVFKVNEGILKDQPKTSAGHRTIPMPSKLSSLLQAYTKSLDSLYLFTTNDSYMSKSGFRRMWESIISKLNDTLKPKEESGQEQQDKPKVIIPAIEGLTPHILRHTYATTLFKAGVDVKTAQRLLGHTNVKMTLDIYTHLDVDNSSILEKIESHLG